MEDDESVPLPDQDGQRVARPAKQRGRRGCLVFGAGVLTGMVAVPLLIWLILLVGGPGSQLRPTPAPPGQPDISIGLSRSYLQRSAERSAARRTTGPTLLNPVITLASHQQGGAAMTLRGLVDLPLVQAPVVADFQIVALDGELVVATERVALGNDLTIAVPGQRLIKEWLDDMVNSEVQARIRSNPNMELVITDVSASEEQLIVKAILKER